MSKGKLVQHVTNHAISGVHSIRINDGTSTSMTSTHHQMLNPYEMNDEDYELVGWSDEKRSMIYLNGDNKLVETMIGKVEPEIVWYPKTKAICFQGHPEMLSVNHDGVVKYKEILYKYLNIKEHVEI